MNRFKRIVAGVLLASCVAAQAQNGATQVAARPAKSKAAKAKAPTQEEVLLQQLNEKFQKLDQLSNKFDEQQQELDAVRKQLAARDAELEQARKDAADAKQKLDATQEAIGPNGAAVTTLQNEVAALKNTSSSLATKVETTEQATKKLENPETIRFKGIDLTPGGFLAAETVDRQRGIGGD